LRGSLLIQSRVAGGIAAASDAPLRLMREGEKR
jgi:hypothetical protein